LAVVETHHDHGLPGVGAGLIPLCAGTRGDRRSIPCTTSGTGFRPSQRGHEQYPGVALDRAGITVFRDIPFLAAGPASEPGRSTMEGARSEESAPTDGVRPPSRPQAWRNALAITALGCLLLGLGCFVLLGRYLRERMDLFPAAVWLQVGFAVALAIILAVIV